MNKFDAVTRTVVSRPALGLMMILCGTLGATVAVSANAAAADDVPRLVVQFSPHDLSTDRGARVVYRRLVAAAETVCPDLVDHPLFRSDAVMQCRQQAVARAVREINSPRLVAIHTGTAKRG